jgi:hypothetical protein
VATRHLQQQFEVQRLGPAHVDHRGIKRSAACSAGCSRVPKARIATPLALAPQLAPAKGQRLQRIRAGRQGSSPMPAPRG